jgi:hypothetical protein
MRGSWRAQHVEPDEPQRAFERLIVAADHASSEGITQPAPLSEAEVEVALPSFHAPDVAIRHQEAIR